MYCYKAITWGNGSHSVTMFKGYKRKPQRITCANGVKRATLFATLNEYQAFIRGLS